MFTELKNKLYFPIAAYFRFFAAIRLKRWNPRVVVVTGSSGKTTLLHLLAAQLEGKARFSHHANSSYGIPFDILDLHRKTLRTSEWLSLFLLAPLQVFKPLPKENMYVVEADTDRPGEGKFLAEFLQPEVVLWLNAARTHGMNFDRLVKKIPRPAGHPLYVKGAGGFNSVDEAIAYDFGYFLEYCKKLAVINGDSSLVVEQVVRTRAEVKQVKKAGDLRAYTVEKEGTTFTIHGKKYAFPALLPEEVFYSIEMSREAVGHFDLPFDASFAKFEIPPGRSTILRGVKQTYLIDSTYNANLASMEAVLGMFAKFPAKKKSVVLGDMLELGEKEQEEHEKLAEILSKMDLDKIVLVGKRVGRYTLPPLQKGVSEGRGILHFDNQKEALEYLNEHIAEGEAILFKGSQSIFLEGIIEKLLEDKKDAAKLPRRGEFWEEKRRKIGL